MRSIGRHPYREAPHNYRRVTFAMLVKDASVPIHAAAELLNIEVRAIRQWSAAGVLDLQVHGDVESVRLDAIRALAGTSRRSSASRRGEALRARLRGVPIATLDITGLQELARERGPQ
jgi:hypothetical protein